MISALPNSGTHSLYIPAQVCSITSHAGHAGAGHKRDRGAWEADEHGLSSDDWAASEGGMGVGHPHAHDPNNSMGVSPANALPGLITQHHSHAHTQWRPLHLVPTQHAQEPWHAPHHALTSCSHLLGGSLFSISAMCQGCHTGREIFIH